MVPAGNTNSVFSTPSTLRFSFQPDSSSSCNKHITIVFNKLLLLQQTHSQCIQQAPPPLTNTQPVYSTSSSSFNKNTTGFFNKLLLLQQTHNQCIQQAPPPLTNTQPVYSTSL